MPLWDGDSGHKAPALGKVASLEAALQSHRIALVDAECKEPNQHWGFKEYLILNETS